MRPLAASLLLLTLLLLTLLPLTLAAPASGQVINGESTDDAAYAPRPSARWHSPEHEGATPGREPEIDPRDFGARSEKPRD